MRLKAAVIAIVGTLAGCGADTPDRVVPESGVAAIHEEIRVDGVAHDLSRIGGVAVRSDGAFAISQPAEALVRIYDGTGHRLGTVGRRGEGPGEFANPSRVGWIGDTLWVADGGQRRLTYFSPDLEHLRTVSGIPLTTSVRADGSIVGIGSVEGARPTIRRYPPGGGEAEDILIGPPEEGAQLRIQGGTIALPFANRFRFAVAPDGERVVAAQASLDGPHAETFLLTLVEPNGDTVFSSRHPFEGEPISPEEAQTETEQTVQRLLAGPLGARNPDGASAVRSAIEVPPFHPPLLSILIGEDGSIWIEIRPRMEGQPLYFVTDHSGAPVGTVAIPARSRLAAATLDRIWLIEANEMRVESVVVYAVRWP